MNDSSPLQLAPSKAKFTFVDAFSGIGGFRLGFEAAGGECVYAVEVDRFARQTYLANFGHAPEGSDIRSVGRLPAHDALLAGFPCQPFSVAGVSKRSSLGRPHGFLDRTQGTLFFDLLRFVDSGRPKVVVLENVKHLIAHDHGRTFSTILGALDEVGYETTWSVVDAVNWVPQRRKRVFLVGVDRRRFPGRRFVFPVPDSKPQRLGRILEQGVDPEFNKSAHVWWYLQQHARKHRSRGNGFGYGLVGPEDTTRTLSARYHKDGSEILVRNPTGGPPRMLTPRECARLMGFPEDFQIVVSKTQAYRQFGNAVVVPVAQFVARAVVDQGFFQAIDSSNQRQLAI
jgi:DNA (cytosine-5)-methyltransferase 1